MEIIGYIAAILAGITLGLIGSGGFLVLPILVYLFHIANPDIATAYSLFIVGVASLMGVYLKNKQGFVNFKMAAFFGLPTVIAIFLTRKFLMPMLPDVFFSVANFAFTKRLMIMSLLATTMLFSAFVMIRNKIPVEELHIKKKNHVLNFMSGMLIGCLSGIVGIGGGFIIVPALLKIGDLTMKAAVGTALFIVMINSFFGFAGSFTLLKIDWKFLMLFSLFSVVGIIIGNLFSKKINGVHLKRGFGWFVLIFGIYILIKEFVIA